MCGRYWLEKDEESGELVERMNRSPLLGRVPEGAPAAFGEIAPGGIAPALATNRAGEARIFPMRWGFEMGASLQAQNAPAGRLLINARSETAGSKPSFKDAWLSHRCALPASWYFEWRRAPDAKGRLRPQERFALRPKGQGLIWLCGLYRMEGGFPRFVVLTREAAPQVFFIHDRMPLILSRAEAEKWIDPASDPKAFLERAETDVSYRREGGEEA